MDVLEIWREEWGQRVVVPFSEMVRSAIEGPNAPRAPYVNYRYFVPRDTSAFFDVNLIVSIIIIGLAFTIAEPQFKRLLGKYFCRKKIGMSPKDEQRFTESAWQLIFYTGSWIMSCVIVYNASWFYNTYLCWEQPFPNQDVGTLVYLLYVIQTGWYAHCAYSHVMNDVRKSDFWVMLIHHVAALILLYCALVTGRHRVGILCLFTLDVCDIFLHFTKNTRIVDNYIPLSTPFVVSTYLALLISWLIFRLWLFLTKVIYTSSFQGMHYGGWQNSDGWLFYNSLLLLIYAFQIYWFYLIGLSGVKYLMYGDQLDDERDPTANRGKQSNKVVKKRQ